MDGTVNGVYHPASHLTTSVFSPPADADRKVTISLCRAARHLKILRKKRNQFLVISPVRTVVNDLQFVSDHFDLPEFCFRLVLPDFLPARD